MAATVPFWSIADHLRDRMDSRNHAREWLAENLPSNWTLVVPSELGFDPNGLEVRGRKVMVMPFRNARDLRALNALVNDVPSPAAIMVPSWGADPRSPGRLAADALNGATPSWRELAKFGSNDVLVNYLWPTAWGDPAFSIKVLR